MSSLHLMIITTKWLTCVSTQNVKNDDQQNDEQNKPLEGSKAIEEVMGWTPHMS